jgi:hypothetical protein
MSKWILLNKTRYQGNSKTSTTLPAGKTIDDTVFNLAQIKASGGAVVPISDAAALLAQAFVQPFQREGQADPPSIDAIMMAFVLSELQQMASNLTVANGLAGATVAAGAAITPNIVFTPQYSGKILISGYASFKALGAGVVTPVVKNVTTTTTLEAMAPSSGTGGPLNYAFEDKVTGLTVGTAYTFSFTTTTGDATATLGNGATGNAAAFLIQEVP